MQKASPLSPLVKGIKRGAPRPLQEPQVSQRGAGLMQPIAIELQAPGKFCDTWQRRPAKGLVSNDPRSDTDLLPATKSTTRGTRQVRTCTLKRPRVDSQNSNRRRSHRVSEQAQRQLWAKQCVPRSRSPVSLSLFLPSIPSIRRPLASGRLLMNPKTGKTTLSVWSGAVVAPRSSSSTASTRPRVWPNRALCSNITDINRRDHKADKAEHYTRGTWSTHVPAIRFGLPFLFSTVTNNVFAFEAGHRCPRFTPDDPI